LKNVPLNNSIDNLSPNDVQKERMLAHILREAQHSRSTGSRFGPKARGIKLFAATAILASILWIGSSLLAGGTQTPTFTMVAYAASMEEPGAAAFNGENIAISEGTKVEIPFGQLIRDQRIPQSDGSVTYNAYLKGSDYFTVSGTDIQSVTYTSELGELYYVDTVKRDRDPGYLKAKAEAKTSPNGGISIMVERGPQSYFQVGNKVTATYYEELGDRSLAVRWVPWYVSKKMAYDTNVNPANFPREKITVTVQFANGQTATKTLYLSFAEDGKLIAELV